MIKTSSYKKLSFLGAALFSVALLGGCATSADLSKTQASADQSAQKADQANTTANAAKASTDQAAQKADQANATADQANTTANAAKAEADKAMQEVSDLTEKIDRMFKKTMQK